MMARLRRLLEVSVLKTLRFNLHYFGWGMRLPVIVARNYRLIRLDGRIELGRKGTGVVRLGFSGVGIVDERSERGIWQQGGGVVRFEGSAALGSGSRVSVGKNGCLTVGDGFRNTAKGQIVCHRSVTLGRNSLVSWDTLIMDTDSHSLEGRPVALPVNVGDSAWIGCRTVVLKGAAIPDRSVVAAQSVITKALGSEGALYGGTNRLIREGVSWTL